MPDPADAVQVQLAKLRKKFGLALPEKISAIEAAVAALFARPWDEQACATSHRLVHSLAGSSGTYGFPEIGAAARAVEALLKQSLESRALLSPDQKTQIDRLTAGLRELAADAARKVSA
jgi:HPt (histidine-containing phosphotransfer) domain-containing protein